MTEKTDRQEVVGASDHPQHRAGLGEGVRAPYNTETGVSEISIFDGAGNERIVRTVTDEKGHRAQGTGPTSADAEADAERLLKEGGQSVGQAFGSAHEK
jgi:hypothetical protein